MTRRDNDDIANALHGLASGEHVEPDAPEGSGTGQAHHVDAAGAPSPGVPSSGVPSPAVSGPGAATPPPPARPPGVPFRASARPQPPSATGASGSSAPSAPARPGIPPMRPRPQPQPQPPPQIRTATPAPTSPPPPARPRSPVLPGVTSRDALPPGVRQGPPGAVPNITPPASGAGGADGAEVETTNVQPVDEDDRVIVPAAPLSSLGPRAHPRPSAPRVPMFKTLKFRRTAIPILLTAGAILLAVVALRFLVNPDAVLATLPLGMCAALAGAAVLLWGVAAMNMAQVRHQLAAEKGKIAARG